MFEALRVSIHAVFCTVCSVSLGISALEHGLNGGCGEQMDVRPDCIPPMTLNSAMTDIVKRAVVSYNLAVLQVSGSL